MKKARLVGLILGLAALTACQSSGLSRATDEVAPQLVMTGPSLGFAAWRSGDAWVVLQTTDGWASVVNRTPLAVPTDGGLRLAAGPSQVAVGILPHKYLTVSPVLRSGGGSQRWIPSQLPGALAAGPWSLARSAHATWAVLAEIDEVVTRDDGGRRWHRIAIPTSDAGGGFTPEGVVFPLPATGFLLGRSEGAVPPLFVSTDAGRSWRSATMPPASGATPRSLLACHLPDTWAAVVLEGGQLQLLTSTSAVGRWTNGPALPWTGGGAPVVACGPTAVWAVAPHDSADHLFQAVPGADSWQDKGLLPSPVYSLVVPDRAHAYAATDNRDAVLEVRLASSTTRWLPLPSWVGSLASSNEGS